MSKKVPVKTMVTIILFLTSYNDMLQAMFGIMENLNVTIEQSKAYLLMLCFLKDSVVKSTEEDHQNLLK